MKKNAKSKSSMWYIKLPYDIEAISIEFDKPVSERQVKVWVQNGGRYKIPHGFECWPAA